MAAAPPKLITAPTSDPVSVADAKDRLRVDDTDDDVKLAAYIKAATRHAEHFTGRAFIEQTWEMTLDTFPANEIEIKKPPLIEVVSIKYDDADGNEQTVDPSTYTVDTVNEPGWVLPTSTGTWPTTFTGINSVRIRFRAGYLDTGNSPPTANVPDDIKHAIMLEVGTFLAIGETVVVGQTVAQLPAWEMLLRPHRVDRGMA